MCVNFLLLPKKWQFLVEVSFFLSYHTNKKITLLTEEFIFYQLLTA